MWAEQSNLLQLKAMSREGVSWEPSAATISSTWGDECLYQDGRKQAVCHSTHQTKCQIFMVQMNNCRWVQCMPSESFLGTAALCHMQKTNQPLNFSPKKIITRKWFISLQILPKYVVQTTIVHPPKAKIKEAERKDNKVFVKNWGKIYITLRPKEICHRYCRFFSRLMAMKLPPCLAPYEPSENSLPTIPVVVLPALLCHF